MEFRNGRFRKDDILNAKWLCDASKSKRVPYYRRCRDLYLYGGDPLLTSRANKIKPTINAQTSFLYAPQSINFWIDVPPHEEDPGIYDRLDPTTDYLLLLWHDSKTGKKFKWCVNWALVYGATIMAILPRYRMDGSVEVTSAYIHPQQFGVYDDLQPDIEEQEAVSVTTYLPLDQIHRLLAYHPNRARIERNLAIGNLIQPGFEGMISTPPNASVFDIKPEFWKWYYQSFDFQPTPRNQTYEWADTYCWDDSIGDYRVFTTSGDEVVWDRPLGFLGVPGLLPFTKVCADEHPEWFWGISLADDLAKLQLWYQGSMDNLDTLMDKIADPPVAVTGVGPSFDEKIYQYKRKSGKLTLPAGSDIKSFQPNAPPEMFQFIAGIDAMLDEQAGHSAPMRGKGDQGMRLKGSQSQGSIESILRISGSQMLSKSYEIEGNAEDVAEKLARYSRRYEAHELYDEKGNPFLLADLPEDIKIRVDGHSNSPVFAQDSFEIALALHKSQAITDEMLLRASPLPQLSRSLNDLRKIEFQKNIAKYIVEAQQQQKRLGSFKGDKQ